MQLNRLQKRLLRWTGYVVLVLVVFLSAAWASFDADRLRDKAVSSLNKDYDVTIESIEKGIMPGNFTAYGVVFKTRPKKLDEKPTIIVIDRIDANVGLLPLLVGKISIDIDAALGSGTVEGEISFSSSEISVDLATEQLDVASVPGLSVLFAGLPATGGLNASIDLTVGKGDKGFSMAQANGSMTLSCPMCAVGPGKIVPRMQAGRRTSAFAKEGVTLPKLNLGDNTMEFVLTDGRAEIETFEAISTDGEIYGDGYIEFKAPLSASEIHTCFRFKFSDKVKKKNARLEGMEKGMERARRQDGYIGMRMSGPLSKPKRIGSRSCTPGETPADIKRKRDRARRAQKRERDAERKAEREARKADKEAAKLVTTPAASGKDGNDDPSAGVPDGETTAQPITVDDARGNRGDNGTPVPRTSGPKLGARPDDVQPGEPEDGDEEEDGEQEEGGDEEGNEPGGEQEGAGEEE